MKFILTAIGIIIALSMKPVQQPQTITLTVTQQEYDLIIEGLAEIPAKRSYPVIQNLFLQYQKQTQPKPVADTTKPKKQ